jgi:hypothetical protein
MTSLISHSSEASVEFYNDRIKSETDVVTKSRAPLQEVVNAAEKIINEKFAPDCRSIFRYTKDSEEISVKLYEVMIAMLAGAEECGGESGKRYVASAILACSKEEDVIGALAALGTTWLTYFLFICQSYCLMIKQILTVFSVKLPRGHINVHDERSSELDTPIVEKTATHLSDGVGNRKRSFLYNVRRLMLDYTLLTSSSR